jgi:hypothetical protein
VTSKKKARKAIKAKVRNIIATGGTMTMLNRLGDGISEKFAQTSLEIARFWTGWWATEKADQNRRAFLIT